MIPILLGYGLALSVGTAWAVSNGASAGMSYAIGRKCGRTICEKIDSFEDTVKGVLLTNK